MSGAGAPPGAVRRLGVLGTLVWDTVRHPRTVEAGQGPVEQWGGLTYSLVALAAACPPGWRVVPIVKIGRDLVEPARGFLAGLPALELEPGVREVAEPTNRVELRYHDEARRDEVLTGGVPAWSWPELAPLLEPLDAVYLNFISGLELDLATARAVRRAFGGPIYADLHSLFLGPPGGGARQPRTLPDADAWLACCDAVQLNETELPLLGGREGDPRPLAAAMVERGAVRLAAVTLGGAGACVAASPELPADPLRWRDAHDGEPPAPPVAMRVPVPGGPEPGDPTGCGDVWGSVFWTALLSGLSPRRAAARANRLAAAKVRHPDTTTLFSHLAAALRAADD